MIAYVKGRLDYIASDSIIVDVNGIGYEILVGDYLIKQLPDVDSEVKIITYMDVKEDSQRLYGFMSRQEKELFTQLLSVSGIGPKGAMAILNELGPDNLIRAIMAGDSKSISKAPGVGSKTAQKVVIELRDKLKLEGTVFDTLNNDYETDVEEDSSMSEAAEALCSLGYSNVQALKAVKKVEGAEKMKAEEIIMKALKFL